MKPYVTALTVVAAILGIIGFFWAYGGDLLTTKAEVAILWPLLMVMLFVFAGIGLFAWGRSRGKEDALDMADGLAERFRSHDVELENHYDELSRTYEGVESTLRELKRSQAITYQLIRMLASNSEGLLAVDLKVIPRPPSLLSGSSVSEGEIWECLQSLKGRDPGVLEELMTVGGLRFKLSPLFG